MISLTTEISFLLYRSQRRCLEFTWLDHNVPKLLLQRLHFVSMMYSTAEIRLKDQVWEEHDTVITLPDRSLVFIGTDAALKTCHLSQVFHFKAPSTLNYQHMTLGPSNLAPSTR